MIQEIYFDKEIPVLQVCPNCDVAFLGTFWTTQNSRDDNVNSIHRWNDVNSDYCTDCTLIFGRFH